MPTFRQLHTTASPPPVGSINTTAVPHASELQPSPSVAALSQTSSWSQSAPR